MTMNSETAAAIMKLHEAMLLVQQASDVLGQPASLALGPAVDLIANAADLAEQFEGGSNA